MYHWTYCSYPFLLSLLCTGTNDIGRNDYPNPPVAANTTITNLYKLIDAIFNELPAVHIFLASILAMPEHCHFYPNPANLTAQQIAFNEIVPSVATYYGPQSVTFVDMSQKSQLCLPDRAGCCPPSLHPNGKGYQTMAQIWHDSIVKVFPPS